MRYPDDMVRGRRRHVSPRARTWIIAVLGVLVVLVLSARAIAGFYTDYLWFDSVHHTDTWSTILLTKVLLATVFVLIFFGLIYGNLLIADRMAPVGFRGPEDELLVRYREFVDAPPAPAALHRLAGVRASSRASARRGSGTTGCCSGTADRSARRIRCNHKDLGFYIFKLPFLSYVLGWAVRVGRRRAAHRGGRPLPERRHPPAGRGPARHPAGEGAPLGAAGHPRPAEGGRLLARAVPAADVGPRRGPGGHLHRRERAAARHQAAAPHLDPLGDPLPGEHPPARAGRCRSSPSGCGCWSRSSPVRSTRGSSRPSRCRGSSRPARRPTSGGTSRRRGPRSGSIA